MRRMVGKGEWRVWCGSRDRFFWGIRGMGGWGFGLRGRGGGGGLMVRFLRCPRRVREGGWWGVVEVEEGGRGGCGGIVIVAGWNFMLRRRMRMRRISTRSFHLGRRKRSFHPPPLGAPSIFNHTPPPANHPPAPPTPPQTGSPRTATPTRRPAPPPPRGGGGVIVIVAGWSFMLRRRMRRRRISTRSFHLGRRKRYFHPPPSFCSFLFYPLSLSIYPPPFPSSTSHIRFALD